MTEICHVSQTKFVTWIKNQKKIGIVYTYIQVYN